MNGRAIGKVAEACGWLWSGGVGALLLTQAVGADGTTMVAILQSLTPVALVATIVVTCIAAATEARHLTILSAVVVLGLLALAAPLALHRGHPAAPAEADGLSIASVNLLFDNPSVGALADDLLERDPDIIGFSEYVPAHRRTLTGHPLRRQYPHRVDLDQEFGSGMALWSRFPIIERGPAILDARGIDVTVEGPDGPVRILVVHPRTPISDFDRWRAALEATGDRATTAGAPTVVVGDLNAAYWHPAFRDLLGVGLTDAHIATGRGWSTSWPTGRALPAFVRLDHALTDDRLTVTKLVDFEPAGSDHGAFVVTIAPLELSRAE